MSKFFTLFLFIAISITSVSCLKCQDSVFSSPLMPDYLNQKIQIGVFGGISLPFAPSIMINAPKTGTPTVQSSLLNGLDGLGYGSTYNLGITAKNRMADNFFLAGELSFAGWKTQNSCNCGDSQAISTNKLTHYHLALIPQFNFWNNFYLAPELSFNLFNVNVQENNSKRGTLNFNKNYFRIGTGLGFGYDYNFARNFLMDFKIKFILPNLLLGKDYNSNDKESASLINSTNSGKESIMFLTTFNIGILYYIK